MRRVGSGFLAALAMACAAVPSARADTVSAAADAQASSAQPALKFGSLPVMSVRQGARGSLISYARFDVSALASEPAVQSAVLRLWVRSVAAPGTIEVVPVLGPWQESAITGASAPELGAPAAVFAVQEGYASQFVDVDVTGLVRDWASGGLENYGLALRAEDSANATFHTREGFLTSHVPALEVVRAEGGGAAGTAGPREPEGTLTPHRIPPGSVMFFDLTTCPQGWTALTAARGRAIVGLTLGGSLGATLGTPLADMGLREITTTPLHIHTATIAPETAHTHAVTVAAEAAHTHPVTVTAEGAHTHTVNPASFNTASGGAHGHDSTDTAGGHRHQVSANNGAGGGSQDGVDWFTNLTSPTNLLTGLAGDHFHVVNAGGSDHVHAIDVPVTTSSAGSSHTHAATAGAGSSHVHTATAGAGSPHSHGATVNAAGTPSVDVTMPYLQLLVCRKD
jgi:hypothetical protein